jgi:hypothetical protein
MPAAKKQNLTPDSFYEAGKLYLTTTQLAHISGVTPGRISQLLRIKANRAAYDKGRAEVQLSIQQANIQGALAGDRILAIWCAKTICGWSEVQKVDLTANTEATTSVVYVAEWGRRSDEIGESDYRLGLPASEEE